MVKELTKTPIKKAPIAIERLDKDLTLPRLIGGFFDCLPGLAYKYSGDQILGITKSLGILFELFKIDGLASFP